MKTRTTIADELVATRTAWLEAHGVPISFEFARFTEAIGKAVDALREADIPTIKRATGRTIPDLTKREHVCEWQKQVRQ